MQHKKYGHRYTTPYFNEQENQKLEADLKLFQKYTGNYKLKIGDLLKTKGLANGLFSREELELEKRKIALLEDVNKSVKKVLEIEAKTTANINLIARDISVGRLANPESFKLKDSQWSELLEMMKIFKNKYLLFLGNLQEEVGKLKFLKSKLKLGY